MRDLNIEVLTMADVASLEGEAGRFRATVTRRPRSVDPAKCTGCGDCWSACPVRNYPETPPEFLPGEVLSGDEAAQLDAVLASHEGEPGAMMPVLREINGSYRHLPRKVLETIASRWGVKISEVLRVASFYDQFRLEPVGRHVVEACDGTSCHSRGARALLERLEELLGVQAGGTDQTGRYTLRTVRCLGLCALSPAIRIDGRSFARIELSRIPEILEQFA
jgi:NADH-quinone oxidoreductase subunit E